MKITDRYEYDRGYADGRYGDACPEDASRDYRIGYERGVEDSSGY
jgi:hypothetical protein